MINFFLFWSLSVKISSWELNTWTQKGSPRPLGECWLVFFCLWGLVTLVPVAPSPPSLLVDFFTSPRFGNHSSMETQLLPTSAPSNVLLFSARKLFYKTQLEHYIVAHISNSSMWKERQENQEFSHPQLLGCSRPAWTTWKPISTKQEKIKQRPRWTRQLSYWNFPFPAFPVPSNKNYSCPSLCHLDLEHTWTSLPHPWPLEEETWLGSCLYQSATASPQEIFTQGLVVRLLRR